MLNGYVAVQGTHPELLKVWWRVAYWYGFVVMFTLLPFHQEYSDSGHFHVADRCLQSLKNNLIFYAVLAVCTSSPPQVCESN